ncbi:META domain-containing protein [Persicitalea jodogahamensis]|nr:META domain-containing protein [Persicitalea jodogahamensis]
MKSSLIALVFVALSVTGCSDNHPRKVKGDALETLNKTDQNPITEKYWKLVTLAGREVIMSKNQERESYFILKTDQNRVTGFAGCNTFNGTYTLEKGSRIRFSPLATTRKACSDVDISEPEFLRVFGLTDNYTIKGDTLTLNVGRRAPLAVFEAVYF